MEQAGITTFIHLKDFDLGPVSVYHPRKDYQTYPVLLNFTTDSSDSKPGKCFQDVNALEVTYFGACFSSYFVCQRKVGCDVKVVEVYDQGCRGFKRLICIQGCVRDPQRFYPITTSKSRYQLVEPLSIGRRFSNKFMEYGFVYGVVSTCLEGESTTKVNGRFVQGGVNDNCYAHSHHSSSFVTFAWGNFDLHQIAFGKIIAQPLRTNFVFCKDFRISLELLQFGDQKDEESTGGDSHVLVEKYPCKNGWCKLRLANSETETFGDWWVFMNFGDDIVGPTRKCQETRWKKSLCHGCSKSWQPCGSIPNDGVNRISEKDYHVDANSGRARIDPDDGEMWHPESGDGRSRRRKRFLNPFEWIEEKLMAMFRSAGDSISEAFLNFVKGIADVFKDAKTWIKAAIKDAFDWCYDKFVWFLESRKVLASKCFALAYPFIFAYFIPSVMNYRLFWLLVAMNIWFLFSGVGFAEACIEPMDLDPIGLAHFFIPEMMLVSYHHYSYLGKDENLVLYAIWISILACVWIFHREEKPSYPKIRKIGLLVQIVCGMDTDYYTCAYIATFCMFAQCFVCVQWVLDGFENVFVRCAPSMGTIGCGYGRLSNCDPNYVSNAFWDVINELNPKTWILNIRETVDFGHVLNIFKQNYRIDHHALFYSSSVKNFGSGCISSSGKAHQLDRKFAILRPQMKKPSKTSSLVGPIFTLWEWKTMDVSLRNKLINMSPKDIRLFEKHGMSWVSREEGQLDWIEPTLQGIKKDKIRNESGLYWVP